MIDFDTLTKIASESGRFGKIKCCKVFKKLPKVQYIAQSIHTDHDDPVALPSRKWQ